MNGSNLVGTVFCDINCLCSHLNAQKQFSFFDILVVLIKKEEPVMKMHCLILLLISLVSAVISAENALSIREDTRDPKVVRGYISEAVLVVDIRGGYAEQSLYLRYGDNGAIGNGTTCEVDHRFTLPGKTTGTDLWLWIGDSIMQAQIKDVYTAQHMYDSITAQKIDPAILKITEGQYQLNVYPLSSGSTRKVKLSFITPVRYEGITPFVSLPLSMLRCGANQTLPLKVLFRSSNEEYDTPRILEDTSLAFVSLKDTVGLQYDSISIPNVKKFSSLSLSCKTVYTNGRSINIERIDSSYYFSYGISQYSFFGTELDNSAAHNVTLALDLSCLYGKTSSFLNDSLPNYLSRVVKLDDTVSIVISDGIGLDTLAPFVVSENSIPGVPSAIMETETYARITQRVLPRIAYMDGIELGRGSGLWYYDQIEELGTVTYGNNIQESVTLLENADIAFSYEQGYENELTDAEAASLLPDIESFINNGGVFVQFIDYKRANDKIASHFIEGLQYPSSADNTGNTMLLSNKAGIVGNALPNTFYHMRVNPLRHSDSGAVNEVLNEDSIPVIVSKKVGDGYFVMAGLWNRKDNPAERKMHTNALAGFHNWTNTSGLPLITSFLKEHRSGSKGATVIFSDGAEQFSESALTALAGDLSGISKVTTVNLLPYDHYTPITESQGSDTWYGSGRALQHISSNTAGAFIPRSETMLDMLEAAFKPSYPAISTFDIGVGSLNGTIASDVEYLQNAEQELNLDRPLFAVGKVDSTANSLVLTSNITYKNLESLSKSDTIEVNRSEIPVGSFLRSVYAQKKLEKMMSASFFDTSAILEYSLENRLLNDFTAFLALEPDSTNFFLKNPLDESEFVVALNDSKQLKPLSANLMITNQELLFNIASSSGGLVEISIFNLKGQMLLNNEQYVKAGLQTAVPIKNSLAKGMYIAVIRIKQAGSTKPVQQIIRFTNSKQ